MSGGRVTFGGGQFDYCVDGGRLVFDHITGASNEEGPRELTRA